MSCKDLFDRGVEKAREWLFGERPFVLPGPIIRNEKGGEPMHRPKIRPIVKKTVVKVFHVIRRGRRNRNR